MDEMLEYARLAPAGARDTEIATADSGREAGVFEHLIHLSRCVDHGDVDDVGSALRSFQHVFAPRVGDANHREHAGSGRHPAEVRSFGEGDGRMLHLDPNGLIAEVGGYLKKDRVIEVKCSSQQGPTAVLFNSFA